MLPEKKSDSTKLLLLGYLALAVLFTALWFVDSHQLNKQHVLIDATDLAAQKMRLSADLIEIARSRTRLSHQMISAKDAFEKDDIYQEIGILAGRFNAKHIQLQALNLNEDELAILDRQSKIYPQVIDIIDRLHLLAFEGNEESSIAARNMIIHEIVPLQENVVDGFLKINQGIQQNISASAKQSSISNQKNATYRYTLLLIIIVGSLLVLLWVIKLMMKIEQTLHKTSLTDGLTGVSNRRCFDHMLSHEWQKAMRSKEPLSLLLIDIDFFKKYNDFYGHHEGDNCLIQVAHAIREVAHRKSDVAARYGGEEFAVILTKTDTAGAIQVSEHLLEAIRELSVPHLQSEITEIVTISIGIATVVPSKTSNEENLIKAADDALYVSKEQGRNRYSVFTENKQKLREII